MDNVNAPIAIFTYNRPLHTKRLLQSLSLIPEVKNSHVRIYCDGPKCSDHADSVKETRRVVKANAPKGAEIIERDENFGQAACRQDGRSKTKKGNIVLKKIINRLLHSDGSVSIDDTKVIKAFTVNPDFPYLVNFSRTGNHWLRMIMELYFEKPSLVRAFYFKDATDFTCFRTHDMDLQLRRENVIYLYRNPVETVYSQLCYYKENPDDQKRRQYWTSLYARHLSKWLVHDDFTKKKTVITYEGMKSNIVEEFAKVCLHFGKKLDACKLESALEKVSKTELKKKTAHDQQVVNLSAEYQDSRKVFADKYSDMVYSEIYSCDPDLMCWFPWHVDSAAQPSN